MSMPTALHNSQSIGTEKSGLDGCDERTQHKVLKHDQTMDCGPEVLLSRWVRCESPPANDESVLFPSL